MGDPVTIRAACDPSPAVVPVEVGPRTDVLMRASIYCTAPRSRCERGSRPRAAWRWRPWGSGSWSRGALHRSRSWGSARSRGRSSPRS